MRLTVGLAMLLALTACGNRGDLKPKPGGELPPKPYGAQATPKAVDLLVPPPQTRSSRSDEVVVDSKERSSDEFDLPPQS